MTSSIDTCLPTLRERAQLQAPRPAAEREAHALWPALPPDVQAFYALTDGATVHAGLPTELRIPPLAELQITNALLYPPGDVIWEELEDDISQHWLAIGLAPEMSQYVSLDLAPERLGRCMDSFIDTHASPGDCALIAASFADWLAQLLASPQQWFWLRDGFEPLGDAYDELD